MRPLRLTVCALAVAQREHEVRGRRGPILPYPCTSERPLEQRRTGGETALPSPEGGPLSGLCDQAPVFHRIRSPRSLWKPGAITVAEYEPGRRFGTKQGPSQPETVEKERPVEELFAVVDAFADAPSRMRLT